MESIEFENWTHKNGHIPVTWTVEDYTSIKTERRFPTPDNIYGAEYDSKNFEMYGRNLGSCVLAPGEVMPDVFVKLCDYFKLKEIVCVLNSYDPGQILPFHKDTFPTYAKNKHIKDISKIVRVIVFLHDQIPGQQLWVEDKIYQDDAGFWVAWQGDCIHMAANLSNSHRYVLQLTGINQ